MEKPKEEKTTLLSLIQYGDEIRLVTVDSEGSVLQYLLNISEKGFFLHKEINKESGFALDKSGRLKEYV